MSRSVIRNLVRMGDLFSVMKYPRDVLVDSHLFCV